MADKGGFFTLDNLVLLRTVSYYLIFVPFSISLIRFKQLRGIQRFIQLIVIVNLANETISRVMLQQTANNLWMFHVYVPVIFYLTVGVYSHESVGVLKKRYFRYLVFFFLVLSIINISFFQSLGEFNSNIISLASFIYVSLSIIFFYRLLSKVDEVATSANPMIWFNVGTLLYYSATFILFVVVDGIINESSEMLVAAWVLNALFYCILNLFYAVALWIRLHR